MHRASIKASVLATALMATLAASQSETASQTSVSDVSATTSSTDAIWTNPLIQSLWGEAGSLLSSNYPSTSLTGIGSLSWPTAVVIGSTTYKLPLDSASTTLSTVSTPTLASIPSQTLAAATNSTSVSSSDRANSSNHSDKRLGIALGAGLGVVTLGLMIFLIWLLHRRRRQSGTFVKHRPESPSDDEISTWRAPSSSHSSFPEKYVTSEAPRPPMPPARTHPALARIWTGDEIRPVAHDNGESSPFYSPYDNYAELATSHSRQTSLHELHGESSMQMLGDHRPTTPVTRAANMAVGRPSTPYSPELMRGMMSPVSPISPADDAQQHRGFWRDSQDYSNPYGPEDYPRTYDSQHPSTHHNSDASNPFLSEEDDTLEPPPSIPERSDRRRSSPTVHYPSGDELSTFDFGINGDRRRLTTGRNVDGGDGYRKPVPRTESIHGRHELN